ncbi:MAG: PqiC family protein [Limisphaerales bacterium]
MLRFVLPAAFALTMVGCVNLDPTPDPTRHFTLAALGANQEHPNVTKSPSFALVIEPVTVPFYLKKSNVVLRKNADELLYPDYERWAEPVEKGIGRTVAENLTAMFGSRFIRTSDQPGQRNDEKRLNINVIEFTTSEKGEAIFIVETKLLPPGGNGILSAARTRLTTPAQSDAVDVQLSVAALSDVIHQYSQQLAAMLQQFK